MLAWLLLRWLLANFQVKSKSKKMAVILLPLSNPKSKRIEDNERAFFLSDKKTLSVTYGTSCHAVGHFAFWCLYVTYRALCHASGHLVIYRECYGFEKAFFTLRRFLPCTSFCCFQGFPGAGGSISKVAGLHAGLRNIALVRLFV